jgi:hypothetical protein
MLTNWETVTLEEFFLFGLTEKGDLSGFNDVDPEAAYYEALQKCYAAGLFLGFGDGAVTLKDATVDTLQVNTDAEVTIEGKTTVDTLDVTDSADGADITIEKGASVKDINHNNRKKHIITCLRRIGFDPSVTA